MAWRDLGLGFIFGAKDTGAEKTSEKIGISLGGIDTAIKNINVSARMGRLSAMVEAVSLAKISQISDKLGDIADRAGSPQMTTGLESTMAAMNKTARVAAVSMGLTGKELTNVTSKMSSMAYGMDLGVEQVTQAFQAVKQTGVNIKKFGISSMKDLVKITEVTGVSAQDLIGTMKGLEASYGFTAKGSGDLLGSVVKMGQKMGFGVELFKEVPGVMKNMDDAFAKTLAVEGPKHVTKTLTSIMALGAAAAKSMGDTVPEGVQTAVAVFQKLAGERLSLEKMFRGTEEDVGSFTQALSQSGMNVHDVLGVLQKDPLKFATSMRAAIKRMDEMTGSSKMSSAFLGRLKDTVGDLPPTFMWLMEGGKQVDQMFKTLGKGAGGTSKDLVNLGRTAFRTSLTIDDQLERMRESFSTRFKRMAGSMRKDFVRKQRASYKMLGNVMQKFAADEGPMGQVVKRFSLFSQVGLAALLPLNKTGTALGAIGDSLLDLAADSLPAITALGAMGLNFKSIGNAALFPLKPLGLFNKMLGGIPGRFLKIFGPAGIALTLVGAFSGMFGDALGGGLEGIANKIGKNFPKMLLETFFGMKISKKLAKAMTPLDMWKTIGNRLLDTMTRAFNWVIDNFGKGVQFMAVLMTKAANWIAGVNWEMVFNKMIGWMVQGVIGLGKILLGAAKTLWSWIWSDKSQNEVEKQANAAEAGVANKLGKSLGRAVGSIFSGLWNAVGKFTGFLADKASDGMLFVGEVIKNQWKVLVAHTMVGISKIVAGWITLKGKVTAIILKIRNFFLDKWDDIKLAFKGFMFFMKLGWLSMRHTMEEAMLKVIFAIKPVFKVAMKFMDYEQRVVFAKMFARGKGQSLKLLKQSQEKQKDLLKNEFVNEGIAAANRKKTRANEVTDVIKQSERLANKHRRLGQSSLFEAKKSARTSLAGTTQRVIRPAITTPARAVPPTPATRAAPTALARGGGGGSRQVVDAQNRSTGAIVGAINKLANRPVVVKIKQNPRAGRSGRETVLASAN